MVILGIDPGSTTVGYSVIKKNKQAKNGVEVIDFGCIITPKGSTDGERLALIYTEVCRLIKEYKPHVMSVERLFFFKNITTAMPVSQTRGVILLAAQLLGVGTMEFTPLQVKMAITGYGRAEKKQLQKMIEEMVVLSHLDIKKKFRKKDDAYDAIGVAICAAIKAY